MRGDDSPRRPAGQWPPLPDQARDVVVALLDAIDAAAPGLIEGFYLIGSIALDDFRPHESDIDFVTVTSTRPDAAMCRALRRIHAAHQGRYARPPCEGVYVTWDDLRRDSALAAPASSWHARQFQADSFALNPVTWHTLAKHGIAVRGPDPADFNIFADSAGLAAWTSHNLDSYWRSWHNRSARLLSRAGLVMLGSWAPAWGVLGVSRLHYTLATGEITSKAGAGVYALSAFPPRWRRIINECLRIRRGQAAPSLYRSPLARRRDALAYVAMVINAAKEV